MSGFSKAKVHGSRGLRLDDEVDLYKFEEGKWTPVRFIGPLRSFAWQWVETNDVNPKTGKKVRFPKINLDYNYKTEEYEGETDPYQHKGGFEPQQVWLANIIIRNLERTRPAKMPKRTDAETQRKRMRGLEEEDKPQPWYFKEIGSRSWTPVRVMQISAASLLEKIRDLKQLNRWKIKGKWRTFDVDHPKFGRDVNIKFNGSKGTGTGIWEVNLGEKRPLTERELGYLIYDIEHLKSLTPEKPAVAEKEWKRIKEKLGGAISGVKKRDDYMKDIEDDDVAPRKKKARQFDDDDDDTIPFDADEDNEDVDNDEYEDNDSGDEEEDDDAPVQRKKNKKLALKKKKKSQSFDDFDDEDF